MGGEVTEEKSRDGKVVFLLGGPDGLLSYVTTSAERHRVVPLKWFIKKRKKVKPTLYLVM